MFHFVRTGSGLLKPFSVALTLCLAAPHADLHAQGGLKKFKDALTKKQEASPGQPDGTQTGQPEPDLYGKYSITMDLIFSDRQSPEAGWLSTYFDFDEYLDKARRLDYPRTLPALKGNSTEEVTLSNTLKGSINGLIELAYQSKDKNKLQAVKYAGQGLKLAEAALAVLPGDADVQELHGQAAETARKIGGAAEAALFTGPVHKKYVNKIVFSKKPIQPGKENEADFTSKFTAGDRIYCMVYLRGGVNDLKGSVNKWLTIYLDPSIDGNPQYGTRITRELEPDEIDRNISYWAFEIIADPALATSNTSEQFINLFKGMSPRKHTIKLDMGEWNEGGQFELDWTRADVAKLEADARLATQKSAENLANSRTLPEDFKLPTKAFKDPALSQANMKSLIKKGNAEVAEVLRVVVLGDGTAPDWRVEKNELDVPLHKITAPAIIALVKGKDGHCYYTSGWFAFSADYVGGGKYGPIQSHLPELSKLTRINCATGTAR